MCMLGLWYSRQYRFDLIEIRGVLFGDYYPLHFLDLRIILFGCMTVEILPLVELDPQFTYLKAIRLLSCVFRY